MLEIPLLMEENDNGSTVTTETAGTIRAIGKDTVHKICSGQVVLSLAVAVKELVENALDAGATIVEVKLREHGLESLEVSDNGCGVEARNLKAMTAKHHTSKLREFTDLEGVDTFGFRGEALSSLCALADMQITTKYVNAETAIKINLDHEGNIEQSNPCARPTGTTVILTNLFATLPVRRRDFTRNIRKEFNKMCQMLQAYCLVSTGVRIICSNFTANGTKTTFLQTHGVGDVLANVTSIFGSKQTANVVRLKSPYNVDNQFTLPDLQDILGESLQLNEADLDTLNQQLFQLDGYVSSCSHGVGRAAKDRQFIYVNARPCDSKNISKVVTDIYHRYNPHQYPFIYLNVITSRQTVDVNLTPDKRQLLIHNEQLLLVALKLSLLKTFGHIPSTYKVQNSSISSMLQKDKGEKNESSDEDMGDSDLIPVHSTKNFVSALKEYSGGIVKRLGNKRKCIEPLDIHTQQLKKIQRFLTQDNVFAEKTSYTLSDNETEHSTKEPSSCNKTKLISCKTFNNPNSTASSKLKCFESTKRSCSEENIEPETLNDDRADSFKIGDEIKLSDPLKVGNQFDQLMKQKENDRLLKTIIYDTNAKDKVENTIFNCVTNLQTTENDIESQIKAEEIERHECVKKSKLKRLRFKTEINPNQNRNAEAELQKEICKEDFAQMDVVGQFNLGFIIVRLNDDLFIVDQHATDEKYNFEMLQRNTLLQYQKLAVPQVLELTTVNELVLMQHIPVFERNGFKFEIDEKAASTGRIRLLGKPYSKNWEFGKQDIDELIFMLQDAPEGTDCRPSRIRDMFASRACRKSVMIGTALSQKEMCILIRHMGEIEQPWNCPHGRPTIRHLINIEMLNDCDEKEDV